MKKVVKFGGSSLANAEQFEKVGDIIRSEESRRFVVPSAPGKRFDGDTKVTDLLYSCYDAAANGGDFEKVLEEIKSRYYEIIKGLGLALSMEEDFQLIKENFKAQIGRDYAASRGEYLNGKVMAAYLGYEFVDAAEVIRFDKNGNLIYEGQWKNNYIHGLGTYIWNENKRYIGEFMHGKKHGKGSFYLNGALIYEGSWKFDKPSVFGRSLEVFFCV